MRGALGLMLLFGVLAVFFGVWGFVFAAEVTRVGVKVLFWVCLAAFILSALGLSAGPTRSPMP
jgi:hypothetical protein